MPDPAAARLQIPPHAGLRAGGETHGIEETTALGRLLEAGRNPLLGRVNGPPDQ
jgi:hypothetical protein